MVIILPSVNVLCNHHYKSTGAQLVQYEQERIASMTRLCLIKPTHESIKIFVPKLKRFLFFLKFLCFHELVFLFATLQVIETQSKREREDGRTCHFNNLMSGDVIKGVVPWEVWGGGVEWLGQICL